MDLHEIGMLSVDSSTSARYCMYRVIRAMLLVTCTITLSGCPFSNDKPTDASPQKHTPSFTIKNIEVTTFEDTPISGKFDINGNGASNLTIKLLSNPTKGVLSVDQIARSFTYTPNVDENGKDGFDFEVSDGEDKQSATFSILISTVDDAPVAQNGSVSTNEDTAVSGTLVAVDVDNNTLSYSIVSNGVKGIATVTNAATGAFTYTPNANANGSDSFTFKANDGNLDSNTATINVTINPVNDAPVAQNGNISTNEDTAVSGTLQASDIDSPSLTYSIVGNGSKGTAVLTNTTTGAFTYTPNANANGSDSFTFRATDGLLNSNIATISVTINPVNDAPTAYNGSLQTGEDTVYFGTLSASDLDGDSLVFSLTSTPSKGYVILLNASTGAYKYVPNLNANGSDSFSFKVNDGKVDSNVATISVSISPVNDPPVANNGAIAIDEDNTGSGILSGSDVDGDSLTFVIASNGSKGTASITNSATGAFTYVPNKDANGTDTFTFKAYDGMAYSNIATITVTIRPVNDPPSANNASLVADQDTGKVGTLLASDIDDDPSTLVYSIVANPTKGTINLMGSSFIFTPFPYAYGDDSFTFQVKDPHEVFSNIATVSIKIRKSIHYLKFSNGQLVSDINSSNNVANKSAKRIKIQTDGKVLILERTSTDGCAVIRENTDGSLDSSFGSGGVLLTSVCGDFVVDPSGNILMVGSALQNGKWSLRILKLLSSGAPDPAFGSSGSVTETSSNYDLFGKEVLIQSDGKIVVAGTAAKDNGPVFGYPNTPCHEYRYFWLLSRYTATGVRDTALNSGNLFITDGASTSVSLYTTSPNSSVGYGICDPPGGGLEAGVNGFAVGLDGNIFLAGRINDSSGYGDIGMMKVGPTGNAVNTIRISNAAYIEAATSIALAPDGSAFVAGFGTHYSNGVYYGSLYRISSTGQYSLIDSWSPSLNSPVVEINGVEVSTSGTHSGEDAHLVISGLFEGNPLTAMYGIAGSTVSKENQTVTNMGGGYYNRIRTNGIGFSSGGSYSMALEGITSPGKLVSLSMSPTNFSIKVGNNEVLKVKGQFEDGSVQNLYCNSRAPNATCTSSNPSVAPIAVSFYNCPYVSGAAAGTATVTCTYGTSQFDTKSISTVVTVSSDQSPPPPTQHTIFVTSLRYNGNFGGLSGADARCSQSALQAGLNQTNWKALVSTTATSAKNRLIINGPIYNTKGELEFSDASDLWQSPRPNIPIINLNEYGNGITSGMQVWTGTLLDGNSSSANCQNWTSGGFPSTGTQGTTAPASGAEWINWGPGICDSLARLYCISQ